MAEQIYVNGVAYDRGDVVVYFGPMMPDWVSLNFEVAKDKEDGKGPGNKPHGRSYGRKSGSGSIAVKESFFQEIMNYLGPLGLDVTDLAPFPIVVSYSEKVAQAVPGLGMSVVSAAPSLLHTQVLEHVDFKNAKHDIGEDAKDLTVSMDFIYYPG